MGGIRTDVHGRTSLQACLRRGRRRVRVCMGRTGWRATRCWRGWCLGRWRRRRWLKSSCRLSVLSCQLKAARYRVGEGEGDVEGWVAELRGLMWRDAGLLRDGAGLQRAQAGLADLRERMPRGVTRRELEARNLHDRGGGDGAAALGARGKPRRPFPRWTFRARRSGAALGGARGASCGLWLDDWNHGTDECGGVTDWRGWQIRCGAR